MTDKRNTADDRNQRPLTAPDGGRISRQQLLNVLADEGYSAGQWRGWLKEVLTELEQEEGPEQSEVDQRLVRAIRKTLDDYQAGKPIADDTL